MKYTPEQTAALLNALAACRAETQGGGSASNACTKAIETLAKDITDDVTPLQVTAEGSALTKADASELKDIARHMRSDASAAYHRLGVLIEKLPTLNK